MTLPNEWIKLPESAQVDTHPASAEHQSEGLPSVDLEALSHGGRQGKEESAEVKGSCTEGRSGEWDRQGWGWGWAKLPQAPAMLEPSERWEPAPRGKGEWDPPASLPRPWCSTMAGALAVSVLALASLLVHGVLLGGTAAPPAPSLGRAVEADIGAVAADEGRCSKGGVRILKAGGNAVDAAVAVALCLGVLNPMASGIGGGNFMLVRMANGTAEIIDSRETAPAAASEGMFSSTNVSSVTGGQSIGVPGELAGLHLAWERFGRMPWAQLVHPAAQLAGGGFLVGRYLAAAIQASAEDILGDPHLQAIFAPHGRLLRAGDTCYRRKLAETLRRVAAEGPSVLYGGALGASLAADVQAAGGLLTAEDMAGFRAEVRQPLVGRQLGLTVLGAPPPSSGGATVIQVLKILAGYPLSLAAAGALGLHRTVEAMKHAFALRMALGDPAFVDDRAVLRDMLSDDFASALRANISDDATFPASHYGGRWNQLDDHGTSHFSVVDGERNAVAVTSTVNLGFGSRVLSPSTGILLNDEMDDFSKPGEPNAFGLPPAEANFIRPGKRPLSSMAPTIVLQDGQLRAVVGGSGGPFIISATVQVLLNYFERGLSPLEAVQAPRVHHQLLPNTVFYEANHTLLNGATLALPAPLVVALQRRGHEVVPLAYGGVVQLIVHDLEVPTTQRSALKGPPGHPGVVYGKLTAVSDPRKDGQPAGW